MSGAAAAAAAAGEDASCPALLLLLFVSMLATGLAGTLPRQYVLLLLLSTFWMFFLVWRPKAMKHVRKARSAPWRSGRTNLSHEEGEFSSQRIS